MRREQWVTVLGPAKKQQPDGMPHRGLPARRKPQWGRGDPPPLYSSPPSPQQHVPLTAQDRTNMGSPEEAGQGDGETQGEVTGQGRPGSPKLVQSAERGNRKGKRERIIVVVRSPQRAQVSAGSANPAWTRSVHLDAPGQRHGQQPVAGTADPGVVKQDESSTGSVDMTKTRSDPQRVRMCKGTGGGGGGSRPGPDPGGGGGGTPSTDPKMVVRNNGFCGRRRFCFRHAAGGNFFV